MAAPLSVTSSAFQNNQTIPKDYTGEGRDISPPLAWSGTTAKSFALICDDPDAPGGTWTHWVLYNLPWSASSLAAGSKGVGTNGENSWHRIGYGGPMPPHGTGLHHYIFTVYALDLAPSLPMNFTKVELLNAIQGHIMAQGQLVGTYKR